MKAIWKTPVYMNEEAVAMLPAGARPLSVQYQRGAMTMWWLVDTITAEYDELEAREIFVYGTGYKFDDAGKEYVGTVQDPLAPLVWHIFVGKGVL